MDKKDTKKEIRTQSRIVLVLAIFLLVAVTIGVSYAFFTYARLGTTENTITTGTITFLYDEKNASGNGITIVDALPTTDANGKLLTGDNNVFDFKVLATTTGNTSLPYEITARKKADSTVPEEAIKIYLTEVGTDTETPAPLTLKDTNVARFSELNQTSVAVTDGTIEKTIYNGSVPASSTNYEKNFRLRMWIADDTDYSPNENGEYPMNNKKFTVTVNVYANATVVTGG
ncbi:MAG: hypothetical protein MRZ42_04410 [Tenericutes bacterium]|nr:hypothetical protein [Mycoplasmatota bacterium]